MKPGLGKAFSFWIVGALAVVALLAPTQSAAAQATGMANVSVRNCTGLSYQGPMDTAGSDCVPGSAAFTFYLQGDGTDESWTLNVDESGEGGIRLIAGTYDVWTPGGPIFNISVADGGTTSLIYGFPAEAPAPPPTDPAPDPAPETATLNVAAFECTGVEGAPIALGEVGPDCTPISTNVDFYLWGDGTDDSWNVTTNASASVAVDLPVGGYDVVNTTTWETLGTQLPSGGATLNIGYAAEAAPAPEPPAPTPETATLTVNTYACTGVTGAPIALVDIGPDCTQIATNVDFYLWGDGTDQSWDLSTSATGPATINLQVGGYQVVNTSTWETLGTQLPSGGATLNIGYAAEAPAPEVGILNINTYECEGVEEPTAVSVVDDSCTRVSSVLTVYMWGDGTDDHVIVTTSVDGTVQMEIPVADYEVVDEATQTRFQVNVSDSPTDLNIVYPVDLLP